MAFRPAWYSKTGVLFVSLLLGFVTAHGLFKTPNMVGGGEAKMIVGLLLMIIWKVVIEFFLNKWHK
jgi:Flp pilus assembly protein protease CpaA